jgi:hypothetical protein
MWKLGFALAERTVLASAVLSGKHRVKNIPEPVTM